MVYEVRQLRNSVGSDVFSEGLYQPSFVIQPSTSSLPGSMNHGVTNNASLSFINHTASNDSFPSVMSMHNSYPELYHHALLQNPFQNAMLSHHNAQAQFGAKKKRKGSMHTTITDVASTSFASLPQINSISFGSLVHSLANSFGALAVEGKLQQL